MRTVRRILEIVNSLFDGVLGDVPCHNTIENWVRKAGLAVYDKKRRAEALVMDESMMIGSQKMLLTLAVPHTHQGHPLTHGDVRVADITVKQSINSDVVCETACRTLKNSCKSYIITDNASVMTSGVRKAGVRNICDISHTMGMLLERTYKNDPDFKLFSKEVSDARLRENMKVVAYLQPPSQRSIARFINMREWVRWSEMILERAHALPAEERKAYGFVLNHASMISELSDVLKCIHDIELKYKQEGLSKGTVEYGLSAVRRVLYTGNERMCQLGQEVEKVLRKECSKLDTEEVINNSSDIVESVFGRFKHTLSPNKLNGVTAQVLSLPLYTQVARTGIEKLAVRRLLPQKRLKDVTDWRRNNLMPNAVSKRIEVIGNRYEKVLNF